MNTIGNVITSTSAGKAKYDVTLKELLAEKQFLARILKRFVPEFEAYSVEDIENRYIEPQTIKVSKIGVARNTTNVEEISNEDKTLNEGNVFYDIIFEVWYPGKNGQKIGMYINVEPQNSYYPGYPIEYRALFYAARRFSSQLKTINQDTNYGCLRKVYSIWLCMGNVPAYEADTASLYHLIKDDIIGEVNRVPDQYDLINTVIIRINDDINPKDSVMKLLQTVCSNKLDKKSKLDALKRQGIRINDGIEKGVEEMCNISEYLFSEERIAQILKERYRDEGGTIKIIHQICKKIIKNQDSATIADAVEEDEDFVKLIIHIAEPFAPDYDAEKIYAALCSYGTDQ